MSLYLLKRIADSRDHDYTAALLVRASDERDAREYAADDAGEGIWLESESTSCEKLSEYGREGVLMRDVRGITT